MSELEQLRKEVNELRERLARLESAPVRMTLNNQPSFSPPPYWLRGPEGAQQVDWPPGTVVC